MSNETENEIGMRAGELILDTLEKRRDQLSTKSTVCAAAATALLFGAVQFLLNGLSRPGLWSGIPGVAVIACAGVALVESLNVVKRLPRRGRKIRQSSVHHILHFQTITRLGADSVSRKLRYMTAEGYMSELAAQANSLAKNIEMRYKALGHAYVWLSLAVFFLVLGASATVLHSYATPAAHLHAPASHALVHPRTASGG
jgi:hypothetical protein